MSQHLQVLVNLTNDTIVYVNYDRETDTVTLESGQMFRTTGRFNIPDNSEPCKYWAERHSEIQLSNRAVIFSFWDDDHDKTYPIYYIRGNNCHSAPQLMPGYSNGGNDANVGMVVTKDEQGQYQIAALEVLNV